jgi:formylglycine-generating enzyme required for sulfatase activity
MERALGQRLREQLAHSDADLHAQAGERLLGMGEGAAAVWADARPTGARAQLAWVEEITRLSEAQDPAGALLLAASVLPGAPLIECAAFWLGARSRIAAADFFEQIGRPQQATGLGLEWVSVAEGAFRMGARDPEADSWERPSHAVALRGFSITAAPVTARQLAGLLPERPGGEEPAGSVSWLEAWLFAEWAGAALPSEAQWECACRAGTDAPWHSGYTATELRETAWFADNSGGRPHPVAQKQPNAWGLFDMHGNVMEWCADLQRAYYAPASPIVEPGAELQRDPRAAGGALFRIVRGGYYGSSADRCRCAHRAVFDILSAFDGLGFRLVRPAETGERG